MASFELPGYKKSKGQTGFVQLVAGDYELKCKGVTVGEDPKQPATLITFKFDVLSGPPQKDGSAAKGKLHTEFVRILAPTHPNYKPEWDDPDSDSTQMGVDQIKSMALAMGVNGRGNSVNFDAFPGQTCKVSLVETPSKKDKTKFYINSRNWAPMD